MARMNLNDANSAGLDATAMAARRAASKIRTDAGGRAITRKDNVMGLMSKLKGTTDEQARMKEGRIPGLGRIHIPGAPVPLFDNGGTVPPPPELGEQSVAGRQGPAYNPVSGPTEDRIIDKNPRQKPAVSSDLSNKYETIQQAMDKLGVYDSGGDVPPVDVADGQHQLAILKEGERVLTPEQNDAYKASAVEKAKAKAQVDNPGAQTTRPSAEPAENALIQPARDTSRSPEERKAIDTDLQQGAGAGASGLVKMGLAKIHDRLLPSSGLNEGAADKGAAESGLIAPMGLRAGSPQTSTSDVQGVIPERTAEQPATGMPQIAMPSPREFHQDSAGGPLVSGAAPTSETKGERRDLAGMERKAKLQDYDTRIQKARDAGDETTADELALAKMQYQKNNPWGSAANHPGFLGRLGHIAGVAGNVAGDIVAPGTMALIPGTALNKQMRAASAYSRINSDVESDLKKAQADAAENKETAQPTYAMKEVLDTREGSPTKGQTVWAGVNEKNPTDVRYTGAQVAPKEGAGAGGTKEEHLNRFAELKNQAASGTPLSNAEQKELNTLQTQLTVPPATVTAYNKQIDAALNAAKVNSSLWGDYHVQPGATAEEAKQAITDAKAFGSETYQQGAEGRTMDKEDRAQQRKDEHTYVYAEDPHTQQLMRMTVANARQLGIGDNEMEEMKAGDVSKDKTAIRMLNDVQMNVNRYNNLLSEGHPVSDADSKLMTEIITINQEAGGGLLKADAGGKFINIGGAFPQYSAQLSSRKYDLAKEDLKNLSPSAKERMNAYLRTAASVPTYLKAIAGIGRSNKETLDLELANVPMPYYDDETAKGRMQAFQENVDKAKSGFPTNLPGMKLLEAERIKEEKGNFPNAPKVGTVSKGHTYNGGDPSNPNSWTVVKEGK